MDPPTTTVPIPTVLGSTSQSANLPMQPKGKTNYEKGEHFLQLSLETLDELDSLSKQERFSASQKALYAEAHKNGRTLSQETIKIRDKMLQKKTFRKFLINLFVLESSTKRFYKVAERNYSSIRRTSDDLNRLVLSKIDTLSTSGSPGESVQGNKAVNEESQRNVVEDNLTKGLSPNKNTQDINLGVHTEKVQDTRVAISGEENEEDGLTRSPCDVVKGDLSAEDLFPDENTQDINLDVHTEQGVQEALTILDRLGIKFSRQEDDNDDDDDDETIRPSPSQSRAPSPGPSCTINIFYNINQSVVSFDSELTRPTLNVGVNEGIGSTTTSQLD